MWLSRWSAADQLKRYAAKRHNAVIALAIVLAGIASALTYPGWRTIKDRGGKVYPFALVPVWSIGLWFGLAAAGVGPQSLSNVVELVPVSISGVLAAYVAMLGASRGEQRRSIVVPAVYAGVAALVVCLRLFMPALPE